MQTPIIQTLDSNVVSTYSSYGTNGTTPYGSREQVIVMICYVLVMLGDIQGQEWFLKMFGRCRQCQPLALEFMPWNLRQERGLAASRGVYGVVQLVQLVQHILHMET